MPSRKRYKRLSHSRLPTSTWRVRGSKECEITGQAQQQPFEIRTRIALPNKVNINGEAFRTWPTGEMYGVHHGQQLAVLTLAWSYILCARLIELQGGESSSLRYTEKHAFILQGNLPQVAPNSVDVGQADPKDVRWFAALLAPQQGFHAMMNTEVEHTTQAPWSYSLLNDGFYCIATSNESSRMLRDRSLDSTLSSYEALQSLIKFCNYHDLGITQLHLALATALLFPTHHFNGQRPNLPYPSPAEKLIHARTQTIYPSVFNQLYEDLPKYTTLSCTGEVINAALCSSFWNAHVSSNLCSPWLQPLMDLRNSETYQRDPARFNEILAMISAHRVPAIACLYIGAAVSGLLPKILDHALSGQPPLDPHAFAWLGIPQSFMDLGGKGPYSVVQAGREYIRRSDCWRLRRLPPAVEDDLYYTRDPFTPWAPPGLGLLRNSPLRVQVHKDCERHTMTYEGVTWVLEDGELLKGDVGSDMLVPRVDPDAQWDQIARSNVVKYTGDQEMSIDATITAFRWVLCQGEGKPPEAAYTDSWLRGIDTDSEESNEDSVQDDSSLQGRKSDGRSDTDNFEHILAWIDRHDAAKVEAT